MAAAAAARNKRKSLAKNCIIMALAALAKHRWHVGKLAAAWRRRRNQWRAAAKLGVKLAAESSAAAANLKNQKIEES